eukprot:IDg4448t1
MGNESPLESAVAALRLKDCDELTWEAVTSDLIQEWKRSKSLAKPQSNNIAKHRNKKFSCGNNSMLLNPESPNCKLTQQAQYSLKSLKTSTTDSSASQITFGSSTTSKKSRKATFGSTAVRKSRRKARQKVPDELYKNGSSDTVQLAASDEEAKCLGSETLKV